MAEIYHQLLLPLKLIEGLLLISVGFGLCFVVSRFRSAVNLLKCDSLSSLVFLFLPYSD